MKKTFMVCLIILLILTGCAKDNLKPCSEAHYKYGQKALEITDQYLNYDINSEEAYELIDKLYSSEDELPETTIEDRTHSANFRIESDVYSIHSRMLSLKYGYTDYNEIKNLRDDLYNDLSSYTIADIDSSSTNNTVANKSSSSLNPDISTTELINYYNDNLENAITPLVTISDSGVYCVDLQLDDEHCDLKKNYYPFAENAINVSKSLAEKYNINDLFLIITFYSDSNAYIMWTTNDFGNSGIYSDVVKSANYDNSDYSCSLSDLKEKYKNFTE